MQIKKVDESTRSRMWKLRQTWSEIFPPNKLSALDVQVHSIDPAWPISSSSSAVAQSKAIIHVNPKFLSMVNINSLTLFKLIQMYTKYIN